jgi:hypothetical protein
VNLNKVLVRYHGEVLDIISNSLFGLDILILAEAYISALIMNLLSSHVLYYNTQIASLQVQRVLISNLRSVASKLSCTCLDMVPPTPIPPNTQSYTQQLCDPDPSSHIEQLHDTSDPALQSQGTSHRVCQWRASSSANGILDT